MQIATMESEMPDIAARLASRADEGVLVGSGAGNYHMFTLEALEILDELLSLLFPGVLGKPVPAGARDGNVDAKRLWDVFQRLVSLVESAFRIASLGRKSASGHPQAPDHAPGSASLAQIAAWDLFTRLPRIKDTLLRDLRAAYEGDPAAASYAEVLMAYPCLKVVSVYRIANTLYNSKVPILPRLMSEKAHSQTGVDIHPGATIGPGFFIDHGTGVVIGETAVIGENVKIYQGVTLGALSFPKDGEGNPIKGIKRHPNIGDNVTIYSGSTILGGETSIGNGSIIGGNCWVTSSIPPSSIAVGENSFLKIRSRSAQRQAEFAQP
jgi:serine O-acetyltransferase